MRGSLKRGLLLPAVLGIWAATASAEPVFFFHITDADFAFCDGLDDRDLRCSEIVVSTPSTRPVFAWVLVADVGQGFAGAQFGIRYTDGVQISAWTLCNGGNEVPDVAWPSSGTGNAVVWPHGSCYTPAGPDRIGKIGFFYIAAGSSGTISFVPDPRENEGVLLLSTCVYPPVRIEGCSYNGSAGFGGSQGRLPVDCRCSGPPVESRSWSSIKSSYRTP